jgi:tetratricopeptide (TPR) repeat protein
LVNIAANLGRWDEVSARAERMITVAQAIGAVPRIAHAHQHAALAAQARGEHVVSMRLHELALPALRANGDRRTEVASLYGLGMLHWEQGDDQAALQWFAQAQELFGALDDHIGAGEAGASGALCELRLGQSSSALSKVNQLLARLSGDLVERHAYETIGLRWTCQQVLDAMVDARAAPMLEQLFADVHARATQLTSVGDRDRLIQAQPVFRAIVAEHRRHGGPGAAG